MVRTGIQTGCGSPLAACVGRRDSGGVPPRRLKTIWLGARARPRWGRTEVGTDRLRASARTSDRIPYGLRRSWAAGRSRKLPWVWLEPARAPRHTAPAPRGRCGRGLELHRLSRHKDLPHIMHADRGRRRWLPVADREQRRREVSRAHHDDADGGQLRQVQAGNDPRAHQRGVATGKSRGPQGRLASQAEAQQPAEIADSFLSG